MEVWRWVLLSGFVAFLIVVFTMQSWRAIRDMLNSPPLEIKLFR